MVEASPSDNPDDWDYDGTFTWQINSWNIEPAGCVPEISFICENPSGPVGFSDLCAGGLFDDKSGAFTFSTSDKATYPPGVYTIIITGVVGSGSDTLTLLVTFVDPCPTTPLTLTPGFPALTAYGLGDPQQAFDWNFDSLTKETLVDCGTPIFTFFYSDDSNIDTLLFSDVRNIGSDNEFTIL